MRQSFSVLTIIRAAIKRWNSVMFKVYTVIESSEVKATKVCNKR